MTEMPEVIIGVAVADLTRQPFKAGVQAQSREFGGSADIIRKDSFRECANFVRLAMSRIQSMHALILPEVILYPQ